MADRLEALGGELVIDSWPGRATVVTGRIPLDPAVDPGATSVGPEIVTAGPGGVHVG